MTPVRLEPAALRSRVKHSTTALPIFATLKFVDESEFKKKMKFKKNTHLSLLVDLSMHFDVPEKMCMYQSLSLSFSIFICKNGLDPDQTRMVFRKECLINLKICACYRK